ncbi:unnamed protein product [Rotaria sp. Silwood2]|nr:unnamed protein product [Rotaria sp. Silwood2]CAF4129155.1 unnamed protein product [Rotaria sp. Silwood2]
MANNMIFIYRLLPGNILQVTRLRRALQSVMTRYQSVHTASSFDAEQNRLIQGVNTWTENDSQNNHVFALIESIFKSDEELNAIINNERNNSEHFDLSQSLVLRCHLVYYKEISQNDELRGYDTLIFNFQQAVFDIDAIEMFLRNLAEAYTTSEALTAKLVHLLRSYVEESCLIWNLYGPSEITMGCTYHKVDETSEKSNICIGRPFPNYQCRIVNDMLQPVIVNQEGELLVGGVGIFAGYLGRDDLTAKALIEIDDELFYRTGDLVRLDSKGFLHYVGRKDFQIKLRAQRIELGEIEQCLLQSSSKVTNCVVTKYDDEHLVAYVQSSDNNEEPLRTYCRFHLPQYMVPSKFIILQQFPLNANGKVDRKRLPIPNISSSRSSTAIDFKIPRNEIEKRVHSLWCEVLQYVGEQISIEESFFNIGGHSLLLIQLYHRYKSEFDFSSQAISIAPFLQYATIAEHAKLLETVKTKMQSTSLQTMQINQGNSCCTKNFVRLSFNKTEKRI